MAEHTKEAMVPEMWWFLFKRPRYYVRDVCELACFSDNCQPAGPPECLDRSSSKRGFTHHPPWGGAIINHSLYPRNGVVNDGRLSSETLWPRIKYLQAVKNLLRHTSQLSLPPRLTPTTKESRTSLHHKLFHLFIYSKYHPIDSI